MKILNDSHLLTADHLNQYQTEGYCVVSGLFEPEEISAIEAFFEEYKNNGKAVYDQGAKFEDIDPAKRQLRALHPHRYSRQVQDWALRPRLISALTKLLGSSPLLAQTMYYFKPPGSRGQAMHQDNFYLLAAPHTCIAAWTPIDDATVENGCLYLAPRSHHKDIYCPKGDDPGWRSYGDGHIRPFPREFEPIPVEVPRGSTLFFGGNLIHGSGPNRSADRCRRTFIGHYVDQASEEVAGFYHPILNAAGEAVSRVRKKTGGGPCGDVPGGDYSYSF